MTTPMQKDLTDFELSEGYILELTGIASKTMSDGEYEALLIDLLKQDAEYNKYNTALSENLCTSEPELKECQKKENFIKFVFNYEINLLVLSVLGLGLFVISFVFNFIWVILLYLSGDSLYSMERIFRNFRDGTVIFSTLYSLYLFPTLLFDIVRYSSGTRTCDQDCLNKKLSPIRIAITAQADSHRLEYNAKHALPATVQKLLDEIAKFNDIVKELTYNIHVIDQLSAAGESVGIKDRSKVLAAFRSMRENLIRALKVERILRENPKFKPELFSIDFVPLEDLKLSQQAADAEKLVNKALQVGAEVQNLMRDMIKRDLMNSSLVINTGEQKEPYG